MEIEDDEGEPTGEWTVLATVDGDEVTGPLAQRVRQILDQPEVLVIELGPVIPLDWGKPWLTALELSRWQPPFWEAGIERTGPYSDHLAGGHVCVGSGQPEHAVGDETVARLIH